jgi:phage shock protein PspC (stress-responsive transcriptional regulator)
MTQTHHPGQPESGSPGIDRGNLRRYEQLRRSTTDRKIAGVAGGLGRHLDIDPTVVRVVLVVLCFFGGAGFLLYGVAWLLVPEDGRQTGKISTQPGTRNALLIGTAVLAGCLLLGDSVHGLGFPWPVLLVGIAVLVYLAVRDKEPKEPPAERSAEAGQWPGADTAPDSTGAAPRPSTAENPPWAPPTPPPYRPARRTGPLLFGPTLALVAVALGGLGLYDALGGTVLAAAYPALALAVVGLMLVVGAFAGRAGGLVLLGILSALALAVTSIGSTTDDFGRDAQTLRRTPLHADAVQDRYFVPTGRLVLDLSRVQDPQALEDRHIDVGSRFGEVVVVLPPHARVDVAADVSGPGEIDLPHHNAGGFGSRVVETLGAGRTDLSLRAHLFAGHIEVRNP